MTIPAEWAGRRVLLHFQAVDYDATVWVNGVEVGRHRGGFSPFSCDLHGVAAPGEEAVITVRARDTADRPQPRGKQRASMGRTAPSTCEPPASGRRCGWSRCPTWRCAGRG